MPRSRFKTRSALLLSGARGASLLGFVLATALLSRALTPGQYGTFRQCWTVYSIALPVLSTGIAQSLFYFVPQVGRPGHWGLVRRTLIATSGLGLLAAGLMALGAPLVSRAFSNPDASMAFALFSVFLAASIPLQLSDAVFMSVGRSGLAALFNIVNRSTVLIGLALPVVLWSVGLPTGFVSLGVLQVLALLLMWPLASAAHRSTDAMAEAGQVGLKAQLRYAWPIVAASVFGVLFLQLDKLVVGVLGSPEEFAIYSNGAFENPIVALFVAAASATAATEFVKMRAMGDNAGFAELWSALTDRLAALLIPMSAFLLVFAKEVVVILFSERYAGSAEVFRAYVALTPVRLIAFSIVFAAMNDNVAYLVGHVFAGIAVVLVAPAFHAVGGPLGVSVAVVAISYLLAAGFLRRIARQLGCSVFEVVPLRRVGVVAAVSLLTAVCARLVVVAWGRQAGAAAVAYGGMLFGVLTLVPLVRYGFIQLPGRKDAGGGA